MKRLGNVWERLISIDNILLAHNNAKKGKMHYKEVKMVESNPYKYCMQIMTMLKTLGLKLK
jgi:hypothetical protein